MNRVVSDYDEVAVGDCFTFEHTFTDEDIQTFATLSGDHNPLHVDTTFAAKTSFGKPIAHGMLVASLFSRLVGMYCPGTFCLYVSQDLQFRKPVYPGTMLRVEGTVRQTLDALKMIVLDTQIFEAETNTLCVSGSAKALFHPPTHLS